MRDFTCKAKRKDNNEWVYGYVDETMYHDLTVIHTDGGSTHEVIRDTVEFLGTKDLLLEYFKWLDKRGMLDNTLCYDPEHQTETFLELRKRKLPETWEEFCEKFPKKAGECYIQPDAEIHMFTEGQKRIVGQDRYLLPDRETAEAVLALCQLIQLRECYNDGWQPNWREEDEDKYMIVIKGGETLTMPPLFSMAYSPLYFKTEELRDMFLNNFSELIEKLKPLYGIKKGGSDE